MKNSFVRKGSLALHLNDIGKETCTMGGLRCFVVVYRIDSRASS